MLEKWPSSQGKMVTSAITSEVQEKEKNRDEEGIGFYSDLRP